MKTRELIKALQKQDPAGECEVVVGGKPIYFVESLPGYYDGCYQKLIIDESKKPYYCVEGTKFTGEGTKVKLQTLSYVDVLWNDPNAIMDTDELPDWAKISYDESISIVRKEVQDCDMELNKESYEKL